MKKIILFSILLFNLNIFAQSFNDFDFSINDRVFFPDISEYDSTYLLTGNIFYRNTDFYNSADTIRSAPFYIFLDKEGILIDTIQTGAIDFQEVVSFTINKDSFLYTFGATNYLNDSSKLLVYKRDKEFNLIEKQIFPQLKGKKIRVNQQYILKDSIITIWGYDYKRYTAHEFNPFIAKLNLNTMQLIMWHKFSENYIPECIIEGNKRYKIFTNLFENIGFNNLVCVYDSAFNLVQTDTLLIYMNPTNHNFDAPVNGDKQCYSYKDSLFIISCQSDLMHINSQGNIRGDHGVCALVVDSNLKYINHKYWYYDSLTQVYPASSNALIKSNNGSFIIGGTISDLYLWNTYYGLLVTKMDSNLNTIWTKVIDDTLIFRVANMIATPDGGVLVMYSRTDPILGYIAHTVRVVKIGPNGEVTGISEFKITTPRIQVNLYPNPTTSQLNITLKSPHKIIRQLQITDLQGKKILQKQINAKQTKLDVSDLSKGVYILEGITNSGERFSRKFLKE